MSIAKGDNIVQSMFLGENPVEKAYIGSILVYSRVVDNYIDINSAEDGVYILRGNSKLYTKENWDIENNDEVSGIAVINDDYNCLIHPNLIKNKRYSNVGLIPNVTTTTEESQAILDFNGIQNTDYIIAGTNEADFTIAKTAKNVIFKNGATGYLPALGEYYKISSIYKGCLRTIRDCMILVGGDSFLDTSDNYADSCFFISSTQKDEKSCWDMGVWKSQYDLDFSATFEGSSKTTSSSSAMVFTKLR